MPRAGFTLIEVIVVIIILSVVAAVIAPRLGRENLRKADAAARGARNLLSIAASRDSLGGESLVIEYDPDARTLALLSRRRGGDTDGTVRPDPLTPAVMLSPLVVRNASIDGQVLSDGAFRIDFPDHEPRGLIEIVLEMPDSAGEAWTLALLPGATEAMLVNGSSLSAALRPIDLDAQGGGESPW